MNHIFPVTGKQLGKLHLKVSALTDRRVRLTGEILSGIRAVKMYTWETPMGEMVGKLRRYFDNCVLIINISLEIMIALMGRL